MTLVTAILVGLVTGLRVADKRHRLWITGVAVTAMLPIQSFLLPLVKRPNFSLSHPGYWAGVSSRSSSASAYSSPPVSPTSGGAGPKATSA